MSVAKSESEIAGAPGMLSSSLQHPGTVVSNGVSAWSCRNQATGIRWVVQPRCLPMPMPIQHEGRLARLHPDLGCTRKRLGRCQGT